MNEYLLCECKIFKLYLPSLLIYHFQFFNTNYYYESCFLVERLLETKMRLILPILASFCICSKIVQDNSDDENELGLTENNSTESEWLFNCLFFGWSPDKCRCAFKLAWMNECSKNDKIFFILDRIYSPPRIWQSRWKTFPWVTSRRGHRTTRYFIFNYLFTLSAKKYQSGG